MIKILAINGSYRENGFTDQTVEALAQAVVAAGAEIETLFLRNYPIEFCLNCGAEIIGTLFTGMIAKEQQPKLPAGMPAKINELAKKLVG